MDTHVRSARRAVAGEGEFRFGPVGGRKKGETGSAVKPNANVAIEAGVLELFTANRPVHS